MRTGTPSLESTSALLQGGRHAVAYADALSLVARQPDSPSMVELFVQAAVCAERPSEAAVVLCGLRERIAPTVYACAQASLALFGGDLETARRHAASLEPCVEAQAALLDLMVAIAERDGEPAMTLAWLRERERRTARFPIDWLPVRWAEQGRLGQHDAVVSEADRLERLIPPEHGRERGIVRFHRAMAHHNALRFDVAAAGALAVAAELVEAGVRPARLAPTARLWTRSRQATVAADIERLVVTQGLPVVLHAGTLLALVREGGFFPCDQDMDLAVLPPATSADVVATLVATGAFRVRCMALDTGAFRSLTHVRTGLMIDVTEYRRDGALFVSEWRHPSGQLLRRAAVPAFSASLRDHEGIGRRLPFPDRPEDVLRATYGAWERPDADFDTLVSAPNIQGMTGFLRSVASLRLVDAMLSGRNGQARHLARRLGGLGVCPELMAVIGDG